MGVRVRGRRWLGAAVAVGLLAVGCGGGSKGGAAGNAGDPFAKGAQGQLSALKGCKPTSHGGKWHYLAHTASKPPAYTVAAGTPKVGATLQGWPTTPMVVLGNCSNTEAWVYSMADAKNFYLAVKVDSTLPVVAGTDSAPWSGDLVQFGVDGADDRANHPGNPGGYDSSDDSEMGMILLSGTPSLFENYGPNQTMPPGSISGGQVAITRKSGVTLYEAAVPWGVMMAKPGKTFGFNVAFSAGGAPYQSPNYGFEWTHGIIGTKWPYAFAQLTAK